MTANRPDRHVPRAPAWSVLERPDHTAFSMIFVRGGDDSTVDEFKAELTRGTDIPDHLERARVVNTGDRVTTFLGYWTNPSSYLRWYHRSRALHRPNVLLETAVIPSARWETLHSTPETTPGVRNLLDAELTDVHEYWGSARDRIPASTTSSLAAQPAKPLPGNLCLIRAGQVWAHCSETERAVYFADLAPNLDASVDYLSENPETGCIAGRFLREQTLDGSDLESTSFVGWFRDLGALEAWAWNHRTHTTMFDSFLAMATDCGAESGLRLWHELAVIPAGGVQVAGSDTSPLAAVP